MTQYQLTLDSETVQRLFTGDGELGRLLEAILNQVLNAQVSEQLQAVPYERSEQRLGYRNGYKPRQLTTRVGALTLLVPHNSSVIRATLRVETPFTTISMRVRTRACSLRW